MPLVGWICPPHGEEEGRKNVFDYCTDHCKKKCTAPHVLEALRRAEEENYHVGKRISVTMLTGGCKRQTLLERSLDYFAPPETLIPTFRGSMIHAVVEQFADRMKQRGWLIEEHLELPVTTKSGSWTLHGTMDAGDPNPEEEVIYDIKTLQEYAIMKLVTGKNDGILSPHIPDYYVKQANLYRYMAKKLGKLDAKRLRLQIIAWSGLILTGTDPFVKLKQGFKWTNERYDIPDIPVLPDEQVEAWIENDGDEWYRILYANEFAPVVTTDYSWLCKVCNFNGTEYCPDPKAEQKGEPVVVARPQV